MKKAFFLCGALLALSVLPMKANDGTYFTSGNQLVPLQETDISIRSEVLTIAITDNNYARIDVNYEFYNPGSSAKKVLMGFEAAPPYNDDWRFYPSGIHPYIKNFTVEMNGNKLSYKNAPCIDDGTPLHKLNPKKKYKVSDSGMLTEAGKDEDFSFAYVYYFEAEFQPGLNRIHHTYSYQMSIVVGIPYIIDYKLTPAGRWAGGKIGDFTLIVRADNTAKHFTIQDEPFPRGKFTVLEGTCKIRSTKIYDSPVHEFSLRNGAVQLHLKDYSPKADFSLSSVSPYDYEGAGFGFTYDRAYGGLWLSLYDSELDRDAFLRRVAHNLPYANRGHVFKDDKLKAYFSSLWWYMPDPNYKDSTADFTKVDWEYVKIK